MTVEDFALLRRSRHVVDRDGQTRLGCVTEPEVLQGVERIGGDTLRIVVGKVLDERRDFFLLQQLVDEREANRHCFVQQHTTPGGFHLDSSVGLTAVACVLGAVLDDRVQLDVAVVVRTLHLPHVPEGTTLSYGAFAGHSEVINADDHVLGRNGNWPSVRRRQDVVRRQHEHTGLGLGLC